MRTVYGSLRISLIGLAVCGWLGWSSNGAVANIITDPDLSSSPPWSTTGDATVGDMTNPETVGGTDGVVGEGSFSYNLPTTVVGATYSISFDLAMDNQTLLNSQIFGTDATFDASFGSDDLTPTPIDVTDPVSGYAANALPLQYLTWNFSATGDGSAPTLTFTSDNPATILGPGNWYVAAVNVTCTANCGTTSVPEPSTISILMIALFALGSGAAVHRWRGASRVG